MFFELFELFQDPKWTKISFFSKSKPLNENRIDRNFIYVPLDLPPAWFGLNTHREKAYWIWKLAKIMFFHINFWKLWKKSNFRAEKTILNFFLKSSDNDSGWFVGCFLTRNTLRNHPRPTTMDMERFYEKKIFELFWNFFGLKS